MMLIEDRIPTEPNPSPETEAFWQAAAEGRFLVRRCRSCGQTHWYPRTLCPFCASLDTEWTEGSGEGTIYAFSVMRKATPPFVMAYVTLKEGPTMMTNIVECETDALNIGDPVSLVFKPSESGQPVPCFRPAREGPAL
jgi:uncharacterized OB-fold protein